MTGQYAIHGGVGDNNLLEWDVDSENGRCRGRDEIVDLASTVPRKSDEMAKVGEYRRNVRQL